MQNDRYLDKCRGECANSPRLMRFKDWLIKDSQGRWVESKYVLELERICRTGGVPTRVGHTPRHIRKRFELMLALNPRSREMQKMRDNFHSPPHKRLTVEYENLWNLWNMEEWLDYYAEKRQLKKKTAIYKDFDKLRLEDEWSHMAWEEYYFREDDVPKFYTFERQSEGDIFMCEMGQKRHYDYWKAFENRLTPQDKSMATSTKAIGSEKWFDVNDILRSANSKHIGPGRLPSTGCRNCDHSRHPAHHGR